MYMLRYQSVVVCALFVLILATPLMARGGRSRGGNRGGSRGGGKVKSPNNNHDSDEDGGSKGKIGAIVGGSVGAAVVVIPGVFYLYKFLKRCRHTKSSPGEVLAVPVPMQPAPPVGATPPPRYIAVDPNRGQGISFNGHEKNVNSGYTISQGDIRPVESHRNDRFSKESYSNPGLSW